MENHDLTRVIYAVLEEWYADHPSSTPKNINTGECMPFAHEVGLRYSGSLEIKSTDDADVLGPSENPDYHQEPYHVWMFDGQKHYDTEAPEGVYSWRDLPFFQRAGFGEPGTY